MIRFYKTILFNFHLIISYLFKMKKAIKNKSYTDEMRFALGNELIETVSKKGKISIQVFGKENLPKENGYVMYSNHQGKYDALSILRTLNNPVRVVIDKKSCNNILINSYIKLTSSKPLNKDNAREGVSLFKEIGQEVLDGKNYLIFPEGYYEDNHNSLLEFQTGCMHFLTKVKCPVVPVCIYDSYKVYGINSLKPVTSYVYFLKPIMPEEYEGLNKKEIMELIREKIQEKLDDLNNANKLQSL